jgi:hypothetical protein
MTEMERLLAEAQSLCDAAMPGPWTPWPNKLNASRAVDDSGEAVGECYGGTFQRRAANCNLIARSRTLIPELLSAIADLRQQLAIAEQQRDHWRRENSDNMERAADLQSDWVEGVVTEELEDRHNLGAAACYVMVPPNWPAGTRVLVRRVEP